MSAIQVDTTRLPLLLHDLRLPAIARLWPEFSERADKEGWPAARFLSALAELEMAERGRRRTERNLAEAHLLPDKTLDNLGLAHRPAKLAQHLDLDPDRQPLAVDEHAVAVEDHQLDAHGCLRCS